MAEASVQQETHGVGVARSGVLPSVSFDYFYGINANEFATRSTPTPENPTGVNLLGSVFQAQVAIPLWNWGAAHSKVTQAQLRVQAAKSDLTLAQRQLQANIASFHREAEIARDQVASLRESLDLSTESLRLTLLRYQAGEVLGPRSRRRSDHHSFRHATPTTMDSCGIESRSPRCRR